MFKLIRSKRRSVSLEISPELEVIVRAPLHMKRKDVDSFVEHHRDWIEKHIELRSQRLVNRLPEPDEYEIADLKRRAKDVLPDKVAYFSGIMGVEVKSIKITSAKKRLGSCSAENGICFSYRVLMYDEAIIDYVVIHELAHIKEHNHSSRFYDIVKKYCPDYKNIERRIRW